MKFHTYYNLKKPVYTDVGILASMTDQSFKNECDLKTIIDTYARTNQKIPVPTMSFVDCTTVMDYQTAVLLAQEAKANFDNLPSQIRERFGGSVECYLDFINKKENLKDIVDMNLVDPTTIPSDLLAELKAEGKIVSSKVDIKQSVQTPTDVVSDVVETQ